MNISNSPRHGLQESHTTDCPETDNSEPDMEVLKMGNVQDIEQWRYQLLENSEEILGQLTLESGSKVMASIDDLDLQDLLQSSPWAFSTRRVDRASVHSLIQSGVPTAGDLVLAKVDAIGHHANLQLPDGRRRRLFPGDTIVVAYGNRYACEQFEGHVPDGLGPCHLVAGGGIAAHALSWHSRITRGPTRITPFGLLANAAGTPVNLQDFALPTADSTHSKPPVIAVLGTAMDAGKTQTAAFLLRGLRSAGHRVGYIKVTGTGAGGDTWLLQDAGADRVLDFTDAGMASTYLADLEQIEAGMHTMLQDMAQHGMDVVVMEVADGVYQRETSQLIAGKAFSKTVDGVILAARDAMGAATGVTALSSAKPPVLALSGLLTASPLQRREAEAATGQCTATREELATPSLAEGLLQQARISTAQQEAC